ncbi:MAG: hypothetical protein ND866_17875 [Pyrinomonadaceae bacterium]|nr:hypothetical protein [Pyrinomonadaceae bacterium]
MKKYLPLILTVVITVSTMSLTSGVAYSQATPTPTPTPVARHSGAQVQQRPTAGFDLADYGVEFHADPRLIIMMAALEAAGLDSVPSGRQPSAFRSQVRKDLATLDPDLRTRLRAFYERTKLPAPATAADQAARYVSLALTLGPPPTLDAPERSDDLPGGILEVLDFASLVREFYRRSGIDERLVAYTRAYQAEGDRLRPPAAELIRSVLTYLHTRPITMASERVLVKAPASGKKKQPARYSMREHVRRFIIVPDLLAAPGAINFRVIGDEYYAIVPEGTNPVSSELRRAYLQYVIDPLMLRFNQAIAGRRDQIKQIISEREKAGATVTPDVFIVVSRSLVAGADAKFEESKRLEVLAREVRGKLDQTKDEATRATIVKETRAAMSAIQDDAVAKLADDYENGALLAFFFAEQLKGIESTGFDVANFFVDMISSFDPVRESKRLAENAEARKRSRTAREARLAARRAETETPVVYSEAATARAATLVKKLSEIEDTLRLKDYPSAETRLKELMTDYPREPRIFFALAQTASLAAADATDENVQAERLNRALGNYRLAVQAASPETDRPLLCRAHEAMGRIHSFMDDSGEAAKAFDEAIKICDARGTTYNDAVEGKKKLSQP